MRLEGLPSSLSLLLLATQRSIYEHFDCVLSFKRLVFTLVLFTVLVVTPIEGMRVVSN